jgi:hypothetical protein
VRAPYAQWLYRALIATITISDPIDTHTPVETD